MDAPKDLAGLIAAQSIATWEYGLAIFALFVLGRSPVLFFRNLASGVFGGKSGVLWQDDLVLVCVWAVVEIAVIVVAAKRCDVRALTRQPMLLLLLAICWVSAAWSIEPSVSARHAAFFAGTAAVGWYLGDRFSMRDQAAIVGKLAWGVAAMSYIAVLVYPSARQTGVAGEGSWSGIYLNRNLLSLVLSLGLLAAVFLTDNTKHKAFLRAGVVGVLFLQFASKSRTGPVALLAAVVVVLAIHGLRKLAAGSIVSSTAAVVSLLTLGTVGLYVHFNWEKILGRLQRTTSLTGRTSLWQMDRWFSRGRPWEGYGFEAIWTNQRAIGQARAATHIYPYSSHNGYYEMLLSVGRIGLIVFVGFLAVAAWRAFKYAWEREDFMSLWPLALIIFGVVVNFSESLFVSNEATWALTVAAAVGATEWARRDAAIEHSARVPAEDEAEP